MSRLLLILLVAVAVGCTADDDVRKGEVGEFCNGRDLDCRPGLVCESGVCSTAGPQPTYDCDDVCNRLADCDASESGCASDCRLTTNEWAFRAREEFGVCLVDELSCDQARASFAPQTCYQRIEVPADRRARCDDFVDAARDCDAANDSLVRVLEACTAVARVSIDSRWDTTERCASEQETGNCPELATCFNEVLALESPVSF